MILSFYHSTAAIPMLSLVALVALWFGISVPLIFLGAFFGYKQEPMKSVSLFERVWFTGPCGQDTKTPCLQVPSHASPLAAVLRNNLTISCTIGTPQSS